MDGNVMLSTELDTRPVTQSLSNLKKKIVDVFRGADVKTLSASMKAVNAEIKATEAQAKKAQTALDALMRGDKEPSVIKTINAEMKLAQKELDKAQAKLNDLMSGRTDTQMVKGFQSDLKQVEAEIATLEKDLVKMTETRDKALSSGFGRRRRGVSLSDEELAGLNSEIASTQARLGELNNQSFTLRKSIEAVRMHPELTKEVQRYQQQVVE